MHVATLSPTRKSSWAYIGDASIAAMWVWGTLPETIVGKPYLGPVPFFFLIYYLAGFSLAMEQLGVRRRAGYPIVATAALLLLIALGAVAGAEFRWVVIDASAFLGLIVGLVWTRVRSETEVARLLWQTAIAVAVLLALTLVGLSVGLVPRVEGTDRTYVYSLFRGSTFLTMVLPCLWIHMRRFPSLWPHQSQHWSLWACYLLLFLVALFSATRSVFAGAALSLVVIGRLALRVQGVAAPFALLASLALIWTMMASPGTVDSQLGLLGKRLQMTERIEHEPRVRELSMLWEQTSVQELIWGRGFGVRYHSPVVIDGSDLALYPHLSAFAFWQKGGIWLFGAVIVLPLVRFLYLMLRPVVTADRAAWAAGGFLYLALSLMSGGWEFHTLHFYGVCLGGYLGYFRPAR